MPSSLIPRLSCDSSYEPGCQSVPDVQSARFRRALAQLGNAPRAVVAACRNGIIRGAAPYDPVRVDAVSIGGVRPVSGGGQLAPLFVRIVYDRQGGYETREAEISCQLDAGGTVVALS